MKKLALSLLLPLSISAFAASNNVNHEFNIPTEVASSVVIVKNPDIAAEAVNNNATEVYMILDNTGKQAHKIVAATSPAAQMVQLHKMYMKNGSMSMHQVADINIKPHSDEVLTGSFHVMLIDTQKQLTPGQVIPITLIFDDGSWVTFNATVKAS